MEGGSQLDDRRGSKRIPDHSIQLRRVFKRVSHGWWGVLRDSAQVYIGGAGIRTPSEIPLNTTVYDHRGAESGALVVNDPDLSLILQAWATLPQPIKTGILAMVRASGG